MKKFVDRLKKLVTRRVLIVMSLAVLIGFVLLADKGITPVTPMVPPVSVTVPEIKLVAIDPPTGSRESVDGFTFTAFVFSYSLKANAVIIQVSPYIAIKKTVFLDRPNVLYVEPQTTAWSSGVNYTIKVKKGAIGLNGEELKEDIVYSFSNTPPAFIELENPI